MKNELLCKAIEVGIAATPLGSGVEHVKESIADMVEDRVKAARRAVKQGRFAADELVDEAEYHVKKHPLGALGASFGIGLGLGSVVGILLSRNRHSVVR